MKYIILSGFQLIAAIPYNTLCKIGEIYNETLHKCVNETEGNTHRILQRTGVDSPLLHTVARQTPITVLHTVARQTPITVAIRGQGRDIDGFTNYQHYQQNTSDIRVFLFILIGFMSYACWPKIKRFLK